MTEKRLSLAYELFMSGFSASSHRVLSLMAGSSADGVTAALLLYQRQHEKWTYELLEGETLPYPPTLTKKLLTARALTAKELLYLSIEYTDWTAKAVRQRFAHHVYGLVVWHPHNVFHEPESGLTWNLGDSERLRALVEVPVVTHFRARDIASGGTGAPLIPNADAILFADFETLINLGGIANLTHLPSRQGYDIAPCNQLLNALAHQINPTLSYDPDGYFAAQGEYLPELAALFQNHPFLHRSPPKALDNATVQQDFVQPWLDYPASPVDKLHTAAHAIADSIVQALQAVKAHHFTLTGGGTYHTFLVELITKKSARAGISYLPAPPDLITYREAIGFGLLGLLRYRGETNTYGYWTGAIGAQSSGLLSL